VEALRKLGALQRWPEVETVKCAEKDRPAVVHRQHKPVGLIARPGKGTIDGASYSPSILGCLGERQELQYGLSDRAALSLHT